MTGSCALACKWQLAIMAETSYIATVARRFHEAAVQRHAQTQSGLERVIIIYTRKDFRPEWHCVA